LERTCASRTASPSTHSGGADDASKVDAFDAQSDLALRDPADVQQIIEQTGEVLQLAFHHRKHRLRPRFGIRHPQNLDSHPDRRKGIAQFVRKRREKLVLATIGFL
jgi:hypothetical protein